MADRFKFHWNTRGFLLLCFTLLFVVVFIVFKGSLDNGFVYLDDNEYVVENSLIRSLAPENLWNMLVATGPAYWHPLTWLSHAIDYYFFGDNPGGHHLTSLFLHGFNVFWVFLLCMYLLSRGDKAERTFSEAVAVALFSALAFGLHPLRVESVVWAAERKDLLCAVFMFPAMLTYLKYADAELPTDRKRWYGWTLLLFVLALMSKPMAVTLPLVLLLFDVYPLNRFRAGSQWLRLVIEKVPFFALSLLCGLLTLFAQNKAGAVMSVGTLSYTDRVLNAFHSGVFYLEKTLWPHPVVPFYPFPEHGSLMYLKATAFIALTVFLVVLWRRGQRFGLAVWLFFLITVSPVIGIVQAGEQAAADRFTYIPTVGFYLLAAMGFLQVWNKWRETSMKQGALIGISLVALVSLILLSQLTHRQIPVWKNPGTLWQKVIEEFPGQTPKSYRISGHYFMVQGQTQKAVGFYEQAIELFPRYVEPYNDLGLFYMNQKNHEKAESYFKASLDVRRDAVVENNMGLLNLSQGQTKQAVYWFQRSIETQPDFPQPHNNMGLIFSKSGQWLQAEEEYRKAIQGDFDFPQAHANLAFLYRKQKKLSEAVTEFHLALFLMKDNVNLHIGLGEALLLMGDAAGARKEFEETLKIHPGHPNALHYLQRLDRLP
jgi:protein O-mannosyl-transferase